MTIVDFVLKLCIRSDPCGFIFSVFDKRRLKDAWIFFLFPSSVSFLADNSRSSNCCNGGALEKPSCQKVARTSVWREAFGFRVVRVHAKYMLQGVRRGFGIFLPLNRCEGKLSIVADICILGSVPIL